MVGVMELVIRDPLGCFAASRFAALNSLEGRDVANSELRPHVHNRRTA
jgi:hypothetical protein